MRMIGQMLSLVGLLAFAAAVTFAVQGLGAGVFAWGRVLVAVAVALLCFWAAAQANPRR